MNPRCMGCMSEIPSGMNFCPVCGYKQGHNTGDGMYIPEGSMVGQYLIGRVLGHGGFGITYIGWDTARQQVVAVKEFFPAGMVGRAGNHTVSVYPQKRDAFDQGLERFQREAEMIRGFADFPGIVEYRDYFQTQGTGYFVMEYVEGVTMKDYVAQRGGRISFKDARAILMPIMDALEEMHRNRIIHRDISPENIYITKDKRVKLLDFGAARYDNVNEDRSLSIILKHGYAPKEQYFTQGRQGPWTDVYAVAATAYHMMSGRVPQSSIERLENDQLATLSQLGVAIPAPGEQVVMQALALSEDQRFPQMKAFQAAMLSVTVDEAAATPSDQPQPVQSIPSMQPHVSAPSMQPPTPVQSVQPAQQPAFSVQPYATPSVQSKPVPSPPAVPKKMKTAQASGKKKLVLWIAASLAVVLIGLSAIGFYVINPKLQMQQAYDEGIALLEKGSYQQSIHQFKTLPLDYQNTASYITYAKGLEQLALYEYDSAKDILKQLDTDFLNTKDWLNYIDAKLVLQVGVYDRVREILDSVQVEDIHQLRKESLYQAANTAYKDRQYDLAESIFEELLAEGEYKDASDQLVTLGVSQTNDSYRYGVRAYHLGGYKNAVERFAEVPNQPLVKEYTCLLFARSLEKTSHIPSVNHLFYIMRSTYKISNLWDLSQIIMDHPEFEDSSEVLMTNAMIGYYLVGEWTDSNGNYLTVKLKGMSEEKMNGLTNYNFGLEQNIISADGDYYRLQDQALYYGSKADGWTKYLQFEYISQDQLKVTSTDGQVMVLTRQK